jgi:hypothetical protein
MQLWDVLAVLPMTLGYIRANGVRWVDVWCLGRGCNHHGVVDVCRFGDQVLVPSFGPRMRCERSDILGLTLGPTGTSDPQLVQATGHRTAAALDNETRRHGPIRPTLAHGS